MYLKNIYKKFYQRLFPQACIYNSTCRKNVRAEMERIKTSCWNLAGKFGLHCGSEDNERESRFRHARINCTGNSFLAEQQFTEQVGLISRRSATFLARIARIINLLHDLRRIFGRLTDTLVAYKISLDDGKANENNRFEKTCFEQLFIENRTDVCVDITKIEKVI